MSLRQHKYKEKEGNGKAKHEKVSAIWLQIVKYKTFCTIPRARNQRPATFRTLTVPSAWFSRTMDTPVADCAAVSTPPIL